MTVVSTLIGPTRALAPDVHLILSGDDVVILDVRADAYLCVPGAAASIRLRSLDGALTVADPALEADLLAAGVIAAATGAPCPAWTLPPLPRRSAVTAPLPPPNWRDLPQMLACVLDVARAYRGKSLRELIRAAEPSGQTRKPVGVTPELLRLVAQFHRWVPYAPVSGKCLLRAFMLLRLLRRHGHNARWVFGVRTWPFQAHCWLQVGDMVLDDDFDRLVAFQPIAVA